jgi:hypothetical protein
MAASMKVRAFWDIWLCSLVRVDRRFRGAYCLYHQDDDINWYKFRKYTQGIWGVSVSIVSDNRLVDQGSVTGRRKEFVPVACVQTSSEAHLASHLMENGVHFPG